MARDKRVDDRSQHHKPERPAVVAEPGAAPRTFDVRDRIDEIGNAAKEATAIVNAAVTIGAATGLTGIGKSRVLHLLAFAEAACVTVEELLGALQARIEQQ